MDKKTKQLLIAFGCFATLLFVPVVIYFFSLLTACALNTSPMIISSVLGGVILIAAIISACIFKNKLSKIAILLALIAGAAPTLFIYNRFNVDSYHGGYIRDYVTFWTYYDEYGNSQGIMSKYKYYDKFGKEVFYGTEEEARYYGYEQ